MKKNFESVYFLRNGKVLPSHSEALESIDLNSSKVGDGEALLARYKDENNVVKTIVAYKYDMNGVTGLTIIDVESIEKAIEKIEGKLPDMSKYYTKEEIDDMEGKTSEALDELDGKKLDTSAYTPTDLSNYYTKSETSGASEIQDAIEGKADVSHDHDDRYYSKEYIDEIDEITSASLNDLENRKLDSSAYTPTDLSDYYTKSETSGATEIFDALDAKASVADVEIVSGNVDALSSTTISHTANTTVHVTSGEKLTWNELQPQITLIQEFLKPRDYIEIGGLKWATMNIGATRITDNGFYFQWGDISGYTASQCGSGEGQKYFGWADYKYGDGTSSPTDSGMTKYNSTDNLTILQPSDDSAANAWYGWRMPTTEEYIALVNATDSAWTADYQGSGVAGLILADKTDNTKTLFFPAAGYCSNGNSHSVSIHGDYWMSSLLNNSVDRSHYFRFESSFLNYNTDFLRYYGFTVRAVLA